ncbi:MAG: response regulator, partial [Acidimicrobiales bacterium]
MKIHLCDDHPLFTEALTSLMEAAGHQVVGRSTSPEEAVADLYRRPADVCLMDLHFPGRPGSGAEGAAAVIDAVLDAVPDQAVVVLTASADREEIEAASAAGARAVALKTDDSNEILAVIGAALAGSGSDAAVPPGAGPPRGGPGRPTWG